MAHHNLHGIITVLREQGERITPARTAVLEYLCDQTKPVSVKTLEKALPKINIVTLYRIVERLEHLGIVRAIADTHQQRSFELADPFHGHHHHSLCLKCGKLSDVECKLTIPTLSDFIVESHSVTLYGYCRSCQEKS